MGNLNVIKLSTEHLGNLFRNTNENVYISSAFDAVNN